MGNNFIYNLIGDGNITIGGSVDITKEAGVEIGRGIGLIVLIIGLSFNLYFITELYKNLDQFINLHKKKIC